MRGEKPTHFKPSVPRHLKDEISASELVKRVYEVLGGSGGGNAEIAQGGGEKVDGVFRLNYPLLFLLWAIIYVPAFLTVLDGYPLPRLN